MRSLIANFIYLTLLCLSAYIAFSIPFSPIPFTAQSLIVFIIAGILPPKNSVLLILCYLLIGIAGAPVFAEGTSGLSKVLGSSGGFLYGFAIAGGVISWLSGKVSQVQFKNVLGVMLIGTLVLFIIGLAHLTFHFNFSRALEYGFHPFWKMALVKAFVAAILVWLIKRYMILKVN